MWMLKIGVGDTLELPDEAGSPTKFRLVGTLVDCPFQSELFLSDEAFRKLYPRHEGFRVFLIDAPPVQREKIAAILETGLRANGMSVLPSRDKVAAFQAVVGTYLTLFQLLGGFGLLLGVLGLAVVLVRGVAERGRRTRFAPRRRVCFFCRSPAGVGRNVVFARSRPRRRVDRRGRGGRPAIGRRNRAQIGRLAVVLSTVAIVGVLAATVATRLALRVSLVPALRAE